LPGDSDEAARHSELIAITVPGIAIALPAILIKLIGITPE
jgi:hypothetical protein